MSTVIDVDTDAYDAASEVFGVSMAGDITRTWTALTGALSSTGAMAGSDTAGEAWAEKYDSAVGEVLDVIQDLSSGCTKIAALFEQTGFNHGTAESASDPTGLTPTPPDHRRYATSGPPQVCVLGHSVPPATGGSTSPPSGWGLLEHAVHFLWPNGDPGVLRRAAAAWSTAAESLDAVPGWLPDALCSIQNQSSPEVDDAVNVCTTMGRHITETAGVCRGLGTSCTELAQHIDTAHHSIISEVESFVEWSAAIEVGGGLLTVVTGGLSDAAAQGIEAARIAATGKRIGEIIETLISVAGTVTEAISGVLERVAGVVRELKVILGSTIIDAASTVAARLPSLADETGAISFGRLTEEERITEAQRLAANAKVGKDGEDLVPGVKNTEHITMEEWGSKYRIPDRLDDQSRILGEVKNVKYQHYSTQLRNYVDWAKAQDPPYKVLLFVRQGDGTQLASTLREAIREGDIQLVKILPK